ncbi:orotate phosphoribosyltransferase [Bacteriovoracales bacterium]|nr:orotate phosphoribosyltransferase [Bacteriovoracales bacterium]
MQTIRKSVAKQLLDLKCVELSPNQFFTYASGLKGPIYCDNRKVLSFPSARKVVLEALKKLIIDSNINFDVIAGLATAGLPYASILADHLDEPLIYIRGKAKGHGQNNLIEGSYSEGQKIILIEDLVNQGSSVLKAIEASREAGLVPVACFAVVDYEMQSAKNIFNENEIPFFSLTNFSDLLNTAKEISYLTDQELSILREWHEGRLPGNN